MFVEGGIIWRLGGVDEGLTLRFSRTIIAQELESFGKTTRAIFWRLKR